jgi:hypothetical protein
MSDFGYVGQVSQKPLAGRATGFLLIVYFLSAALEIIDLLGTAINPVAVSDFACSIQAFAIIQIPDMSGHSSPFVTDPCLGAAHEPTFSLIFLSVKLTMAIFAFAILWGFVGWRPDGFCALRDDYWQRFGAPGGYRNELKTFGRNSFGVIFFLSSCLLLACICASIPELSFALALKFIVEDGLAVAIPAVALDVTARALLFVSFAWGH